MGSVPTNKPKLSNIKVLANTKIFNVESVDIDFNNGQVRTYQRLKSKNSRGAVLVVPVFDNNIVALIYEFCVGTERYELALPKGKIDDKESIIAAANRELQEEVGFAANNLVHINSLTANPGYQSSTIHVVVATDLYPSKLEGDEPEKLITTYKDLAALDSWVDNPLLTEARSIAALYMAKKFLKITT